MLLYHIYLKYIIVKCSSSALLTGALQTFICATPYAIVIKQLYEDARSQHGTLGCNPLRSFGKNSEPEIPPGLQYPT